MNQLRKGNTALLLIALMAVAAWFGPDQYARAQGRAKTAVKNKVENTKLVRTCVINGFVRTGMWKSVSDMFSARTGYRVEVVATGPKFVISKPFKRGEADLLTMHSSDMTTDLVVEGYGVNIRPWTRNDLVILGPPSDPAGIRGLQDGAEAFRRIAKTQSNFLDIMGLGKRSMNHMLWKKAGIRPRGSWVLKDESGSRHRALKYAAGQGAYTTYGRVPVVTRKVSFGNLEIMVTGDPAMRRPYMVMEANPEIFPHVNHKGARALSDFLLSKEVQTFLAGYGREQNDGYPYFYPVWPYNADEKSKN